MDRHEIARKHAQDLAGVLGVTLSQEAVYSYDETGQASAWRVNESSCGARIAINVEDDDNPYGVLETGPLDQPDHLTYYQIMSGLGWIDQGAAGPLVNPLGAAHPALH